MTPETWIFVFTLFSFLTVVVVLGKFGWPKIIKTLEEREHSIRQAIESAERARKTAEQMKLEYENQMEEAQQKVREIITHAHAQGAKTRESILMEAEEEARRLSEKTRQHLQMEKEKILREMRGEVANISIMMAEKLIEKSVDKQVQEKFIQDFLKSMETPPGKMH